MIATSFTQLETVQRALVSVNVEKNSRNQTATAVVLVTLIFQTVNHVNVMLMVQEVSTVKLMVGSVHVNLITVGNTVTNAAKASINFLNVQVCFLFHMNYINFYYFKVLDCILKLIFTLKEI